MKITTKKLEIIFVIVYLLIAVFCYVFAGSKCLIGSFTGALVGIGDWYIIKLMSIWWLKRGRFSLIENSLRYLFVGFSIWILFELKFDVLGIVLGLSVVPLSIMIMSVFALINKNITV